MFKTERLTKTVVTYFFYKTNWAKIHSSSFEIKKKGMRIEKWEVCGGDGAEGWYRDFSISVQHRKKERKRERERANM